MAKNLVTEKGLNTFLVKEMDKIKSGQVFEKDANCKKASC